MLNYTKTKPTKVNIGERKKPTPFGKPGFLRVDSVHQGDLDKKKGLYHINLVDEVTQWQIVGCVEGISEYFMVPLLEELLKSFPFTVLGFHSDNGSEYINQVVAKLLDKLNVSQYLKPGVTKETLIEEQMKMSHVEAAQKLQAAKAKLFKQI